ncbi:MAG: phosphatidate cytidylyltransferase [Anaerolineae bacterium]
MFVQRVLSALILVPLVGLAVYAGGWWYFALVAGAALTGCYEFYRMVARDTHRPAPWPGMALAALLLLGARYPAWGVVRAGLAAAIMLAFGWQLFQPQARRSLTDWALTLAGGLYVGWLAGHFISLRQLPRGLEWTALMFLATWANDTGAYFAGLSLGRRPFAPHISPHKTWEGSIGGWLTGVVATALIGSFVGLSLTHGVLLGLAIALAATLGDLAVSFIKRQVGVKDSSHLIPGHGGMLDRMDSLLFTVVVVYYYVVWIAGG